MTMTIQKRLPLFWFFMLVLLNHAWSYGQVTQPSAYSGSFYGSSSGVLIPTDSFMITPQDANTHYYSPDAPELINDWDKFNTKRKESAEGMARNHQIQRQFEDALWTLKNKILESRLAELAKLKPTQEPDVSRWNFNVFLFPELDGSTSCDLLGKIVIARLLGIPYQWTSATVQFNNRNQYQQVARTFPSNHTQFFGGGDASMQYRLLQVIPDMDKANFRQRYIFFDYFGRFQGTHESYLSLIGPPKNADPNASPPVGNMASTDYPTSYTTSSVVMPSGAAGPTTILIGDQFFPPSEIILVARKPSEDELKAAREAEVELDVRPIALDAFVFLVNRTNPVESLTLEEIRSIYANPGPTNWKSYGGPDQVITPYERNRNSGSRELMDEMVVTPEAREKYAKLPQQPPTMMSATVSGQNTVQFPVQSSDSFGTPVATQPNGTWGGVSNVPQTQSVTPVPQAQYIPFQPTPSGSLPVTTQPAVSAYTQYTPPSTNPEQAARVFSAFRDQRRTAEGGGGMMSPYLSIVQDPAGIAYSVYHYEHFMVNVLESRTLAVDGVMPGYETIRTKQYPLVSEVYVVTRKDIAADSPTAKLRDWLLTDNGQRTIRESGYVPINPIIAAE
ncbi:MAG: substrate-binding domain-containing protein [Planctomycetaceae bacterium]|nr:substrate-binding domain-containing protein [Planctomycetaceae bacterium]